MEVKMKLTFEQYCIALGLFSMAHAKQQEVNELERQLNVMLGLEDGSHISDAIYTRDDTLSAALKREGIEFEATPRKGIE